MKTTIKITMKTTDLITQLKAFARKNGMQASFWTKAERPEALVSRQQWLQWQFTGDEKHTQFELIEQFLLDSGFEFYGKRVKDMLTNHRGALEKDFTSWEFKIDNEYKFIYPEGWVVK